MIMFHEMERVKEEDVMVSLKVLFRHRLETGIKRVNAA
jgi:hypothetical protein